LAATRTSLLIISLLFYVTLFIGPIQKSEIADKRASTWSVCETSKRPAKLHVRISRYAQS